MASGDNDFGDNAEPLWRHVDVLEGSGSLDEDNVRFLCDYCNRVFHGNYSAVQAHLLEWSRPGVEDCTGLTDTIRTQLENEYVAAEDSDGRTMPVDVPLIHSATSSDSSGRSVTGKAIVHPKRRKKNKDLHEDIRANFRDLLDAEIARLFYSAGLALDVAKNPYYEITFSLATRKKDIPGCTDVENASMESQDHWASQVAMIVYCSGLPFNLARNPYYHGCLSVATMVHIPGYLPPGPEKLKTTLLKQERARIEGMLETIKSTWRKAIVTIVCDGWSDAERRPVINILAVSESGPVFLGAIYNEDKVKRKAKYIAAKLIAAIKDVGPENVVQVITDNDPVCRDAGVLIEEKYNHIQWMPSVAHTLSLVLKSICAAMSSENLTLKGCQWISDVVEAATVIKSFIVDHSMALSMFDEFSKLKMLTVADTRFASDIVMLKRFQLIKQSLQMLVICDQWSAYRKENMRQAKIVKKKLLDDLWWDQVDYILAFTEPIYSMIRLVDTEKACLHLVYGMWNDMIEKVKIVIYEYEGKAPEEESVFYSAVHDILVDWWSKSKTPLDCLAHTLNPRYYSDSWIDEDANYLPPHYDAGISEMRNSSLKKLFPAADDLKIIKEEYAGFVHLGNEHFSLDSAVDRDILDPKTWWVTHGASAPRLQSLALKLLHQPASSSCYERNWAAYSLIHKIMAKKRRSEWAEDMVFVHTNLHLFSRTTERYYTDPKSKLWDVEGDCFESNVVAGVLEFATLSLDEPEFEREMMEEADLGKKNEMATEEA